MNLWKGYVLVRIEGDARERFLNLCVKNQLFLWNITVAKEYLMLNMRVKDFKKLQPIIRKTGIHIRIERRFGMPFFLNKYRKRKMFFAGIILCMGLIYGFSLFVWDIQIEGNSQLTDQVLYDYLKTQRVEYGAWKATINCSRIEEQLRSRYNEIIWTSVEKRGTRLIVSIQEGIQPQNVQAVQNGTTQEENAASLCATKNGVVTKMITRQGTPMVGIGSPVTEGAVLVDGCLPIIGDDGTIVANQYCQADADIYIQTVYEYVDSFSLTYEKKEQTKHSKTHYYVKIFQTLLNFQFHKPNWEHVESVTTETQLKLWSNFYLPVFWGKETQQEYRVKRAVYSQTEAKELAEKNLNLFCENLERKGVQIIENNVKIAIDHSACQSRGQIQVIEKTGERKPLQKVKEETSQEEEGRK